MRICLAFLLLLGLALPFGAAAEPKVRFGVKPDLKMYPQASAKETLASVIKALENKQVEYVLAHLADPEWVDQRVAVYEGQFGVLREEAASRLDASALKLLQRFLKDGEWAEGKDKTATVVSLKSVPDRVVRLRKIDDRWYLEQNSRPR